VDGQGHRRENRYSRAHQGSRGRARASRGRARPDLGLGRATWRGGHRGCRADDGRGRCFSAMAQGRGNGRRLPGEDPEQRVGSGSRLLHRRQSGRVGAAVLSELTRLTLAEARDGLGRGDFSAREITEAHLSAIEQARSLNMFITETPERALADAGAADERRARGEPLTLDGLPIAVKDLFCTDGILSTAASHILDGFVPPYESTVSAKLRDAGTVLLGKTNLDEFAMGSANVTSYYGEVENPWRARGDNRRRVPGGSSGGSAAAVAGRCALAAIGTDTGGSIRQPAAFCGIVGLKPTYGRCSRWGIIAFASSLDQAGPMTRTVRDAAIMLRHMAGHDPKDSTSAPREVPDFEAVIESGVRGMRIGIPKEYRVDGMSSELEALWQQG